MKHGWSGMEPPTLPASTPSSSLLASKGTDLALERKALGVKASNQDLPQLLFFFTRLPSVRTSHVSLPSLLLHFSKGWLCLVGDIGLLELVPGLLGE